MAKKDCLHCKNCIISPMAYHDGVTNTCKLEYRLQKLSLSELFRKAEEDECDEFEAGEPEKRNEINYND